MDEKAKLLGFIAGQRLAVISTVSADGLPEAAVIGLGQTNNLELIFGTDNTSRKFQNLRTNPKVALVIGWEDGKTVQYEGTAEELPAGAESKALIGTYYWTKNPESEKYYGHETERYFIVRPTWIRYTDISVDPWEIIELPPAS